MHGREKWILLTPVITDAYTLTTEPVLYTNESDEHNRQVGEAGYTSGHEMCGHANDQDRATANRGRDKAIGYFEFSDRRD
jgi:hypothetical protein